MTIEAIKLTPWVSKVIERVKNDRKLNGLSFEDFRWLHLPCGDKVTVVETKKGIQARCSLHNVSSRVEETLTE